MRKIVLLLPFLFVFCNCSTDDSINNMEDELLLVSAGDEGDDFHEKAATVASCFSGVTASVSVDVSGGFGNPVLVFTPHISGKVSQIARYMVSVEVQPLSDCDNMSSNTGSLLTFGPSDPVQNVYNNPPKIRVLPSSLPPCYKWRYVFEGVSSTCTSVSPWYETPVY